MDKVERSNRGAAATPQGIKPGAMTNDSFDTADSNDAGAASPATAPQDKPDNKPIKSKTNSRELLIDGEDRVETICEQTTTRIAAIKEVETPEQAPHAEGMKIADDGTQVVSGQANQNQGSKNKKPGEMLIDGTDTIANVQTGNLVQPDTTINSYSENYQEFWERLRAEANAAGKDSITYYYEYKKEEFRARNGNEAALPKDMVDAIQYTMLILDVANRNDKLTQEERKTYTITKNKEKNISITGNKDLISNYNRELLNAIVHQARKAGSTESQIQGLLAAMVRNPGSFRISSDFTKAQKKVYAPGTDKKGIYQPPYFYECLAHAGIDITAIDKGKTQADDYDLVSIFFMDVIGSADYSLTLGIIGTDVHVTIMHLDKEDVKKAVTQGSFKPGDTISKYPERNNGASGGIHYHIEVTTLVNGKRKFVNPVTLERAPEGTRFEYRYGKIERLNTPMSNIIPSADTTSQYGYHMEYISTGYDYTGYWWMNPELNSFIEINDEIYEQYHINWSKWFKAIKN
ncbi:MAG TPA: hypothetical protein PK074_02915 [Spirochaetales bacterium]|nr:hypothetical protein [Spirochaetales bacterium]